MPKTKVEVQLSGQDGNVFNLMGIVSLALKRAGYKDLSAEFRAEVMKAQSYADALAIMGEYVEVS